jgi:hypothetical protein
VIRPNLTVEPQAAQSSVDPEEARVTARDSQQRNVGDIPWKSVESQGKLLGASILKRYLGTRLELSEPAGISVAQRSSNSEEFTISLQRCHRLQNVSSGMSQQININNLRFRFCFFDVQSYLTKLYIGDFTRYEGIAIAAVRALATKEKPFVGMKRIVQHARDSEKDPRCARLRSMKKKAIKTLVDQRIFKGTKVSYGRTKRGLAHTHSKKA